MGLLKRILSSLKTTTLIFLFLFWFFWKECILMYHLQIFKSRHAVCIVFERAGPKFQISLELPTDPYLFLVIQMQFHLNRQEKLFTLTFQLLREVLLLIKRYNAVIQYCFDKARFFFISVNVFNCRNDFIFFYRLYYFSYGHYITTIQ